MRIAWGLALLALAACALAQGPQRGQRRTDPSAYFESGRLIHTEAVSLAGDTPDKSRALAIFSIAYDALTFQRAAGGTNGRFTASVAVRLELLDARDVTVARASWYDTVRVATFLETNDKDATVVGLVPLDAPPGPYTISWSIEDGNSRQSLRDFRQPVVLRDMHAAPAVSSPLLTTATGSDGTVRLHANGGNAEFGLPLSLVYEMNGAGPDVQTACRLMRYGLDSVHISVGAGTVTPHARCVVSGKNVLQIVPDAASSLGIVRIDVPQDSLEQGEYAVELTVRRGSDSAVVRTPFRVTWSTRPLSLWDIDYAIDAMRYVLTDGQLDSMKSGNIDDRRRAFNAWWKTHDPTPLTPFNEYEAEYFKRVDYAARAFLQLPGKMENDGSRTDQGKIWILFGKPTSTDRKLLPDQPPMEVWTYANNVKKRFTFVDEEKNGVYRLTKVENL